ncbi:hypothetical protein DL767_007993 [Monosporascus sp. MG133]|nr:hypothetical protein DL767_007993 [Monosporascus sp. MG133]
MVAPVAPCGLHLGYAALDLVPPLSAGWIAASPPGYGPDRDPWWRPSRALLTCPRPNAARTARISLALPAAVPLLIGNITQQKAAEHAGAVNKFGSKIRLVASLRVNFIAIAWSAFALTFMAILFWGFPMSVARNAPKRSLTPKLERDWMEEYHLFHHQ